MTTLTRFHLIFLILISSHAQSAPKTLWEIGKFDQSPVEFSTKLHESVNYRVGASDPGKDWPAHQETGATYRILFPLEAPSGSYSLRVATLIDRPRVPALQIDVNGHAGKFYLHPKLSYSRSDFSYAFDPHESQSSLAIDVPSSFLKPGENVITVTCVDDPPSPPAELELGGISYDALLTKNSCWKRRAINLAT